MTRKVPDVSGERPQYGLYVGYSVIAGVLLLGLVGVALVVAGFFVGYPVNVVFWVVGGILAVVFLWPGFGMLSTNRDLQREESLHFDFLRRFDNAQILDCGCGTGRHAIPLAKQMPQDGFLTGIDIFDSSSISLNALERVERNAEIEGVSERTRFMVGSVADIPFDDAAFDVVTCMGVMHELRGLKAKAFQEIRRVLRPNGLFYLRELKKSSLVPTAGVFALFAFHGEGFWEKQLTGGGFEIVDRCSGGNYYEFLAKKAA